ncbi:MerR family transcriptional regulator [Oleomonas cavernae]|uniref:MerR family transcriptional regulator n=2 Tax=Oleomonas cavernae TaxID=2320859 RepID=A0A418WBC4_9PROT|nr:MerR family transcriptional regulator [Oleomonas cavernae]
MHIRELTSRAGVAERQVRYLIAEGFIPPPRGGRSNAEYGDDHVAAIDRYVRLRDLGFPPAAIKLLLQSREGVPFPVSPGITLVVDPSLLATGAPVQPVIDTLRSLLTDLFKEQAHAHDARHD